MRSDYLNLIVDVEDAFGFAIADEEAAGIDTVGKLYDYVLAHRLCAKRDACLSSMTFYRLRQAMMSVLRVPRDAVRATTEMTSLVPRNHRRIWRNLQAATSFRLPELRRPTWLVRLAALLTAAAAIAMPMALQVKPGHGLSLVAIASAIVFGYGFVWLTKPMMVAIPAEYATVGQFMRATMARNYWAITAAAQHNVDDAQAWATLQRLVGKHFGVSPESVAKDRKLDK